MTDHWKAIVLKHTNARDAIRTESIQPLWSGYGEIFRVQLIPETLSTIVVKQVLPPVTNQHPRGWNTDNSAIRKLRSYQIETHWYTQWSARCTDACRVPRCIGIEQLNNQTWILLEDLDASGFAYRHTHLNPSQASVCLRWLAHFHAQFINAAPEGLWPVGTYWHLDTRSDEFDAMKQSSIKANAHKLDGLLNACHYKTIVHGDAKVANFCFSKSDQSVAAVDFQYVGGGCGMKDVAYFLGSCFDENECERWIPDLLDTYFDTLRSAVKGTTIDTIDLEREWRQLFAPAWTDFHRFLLGWMPEHNKIHAYTEKLSAETLASSHFTI